MSIDLTPKPQLPMAAFDLSIDDRGIIRGNIWISVGNIPQGHIQLTVASMEALKMFSNQIVQWIQTNDKRVQAAPAGLKL